MQKYKISFKGQKIFIGIDVHMKKWDVAIAPEVGIVKRHTQKASAKELFDFLKKHYPDGDYLAVYESGFSGFSTYYALKDVGIDCIVIHAADVPTTQYELWYIVVKILRAFGSCTRLRAFRRTSR